ncbi:MAG: hypothetical protein IPH77_10730 [Ignavibacteria bacterium]|nr:hypothetical protein [Ignavibacteria bacterium]
MLDHDIIQMRQVYNESNKSNWGFIPLTENEFSKTAHQFRQFVPDNLILLVEKDEHQIGLQLLCRILIRFSVISDQEECFPSGL